MYPRVFGHVPSSITCHDSLQCGPSFSSRPPFNTKTPGLPRFARITTTIVPLVYPQTKQAQSIGGLDWPPRLDASIGRLDWPPRLAASIGQSRQYKTLMFFRGRADPPRGGGTSGAEQKSNVLQWLKVTKQRREHNSYIF